MAGWVALGSRTMPTTTTREARSDDARATPETVPGDGDLYGRPGRAVTSRKIRDGAVQLIDLAASARPGLPTMVGTMNAGGREILPDWSTLLTTTLPPGTWQVMGKGIMFAWEAEVTCDVVSGTSNILDRTTLTVRTDSGPGSNTRVTSPMALLGWVTVTQPTPLGLKCHRNDFGTLARVYDTKLAAVQVDNG